jgi:MFS family permease
MSSAANTGGFDRRQRAFLLSCLCAFTGGHVVNYSVIMYAQEMLQSDLLSGIGFGLCFGPPLLLGWYAGVLCDRRSPVAVIHFAQGMFVLAALGLALGEAIGVDAATRAPFVLGAALCAGIGWSFAAPARMTVLARIVEAQQLKRASMIFNLLVMLGFGLGPLAIAGARYLVGWQAAFGIAAMLFVAGSLLLLGLVVPAAHKIHRPVLVEIGEALRAVRANALVGQLLLCSVFCYMLMGPMQILLPRLARSGLGLGELQRGAFLGMLAPSLIVGGALALALGARWPNGKTIFAAAGISGLLFAVLGSMHAALPALALLICIGIGGGVGISLIVAAIQAHVEESVRGRVLSMYTIISQFVPAASGLCAGVLSHFFDVSRAAMLCGALLAVAALVNAVWMRTLRRY